MQTQKEINELPINLFKDYLTYPEPKNRRERRLYRKETKKHRKQYIAHKKAKVLPGDIQDPILRQVCQQHGTDWLLTLSSIKPSERIYIPRRMTLEMVARDRVIRKSKESIKTLAGIFGITPMRIRQIKREG